jgi:Regulator of ribonuclease activity B
MADDFPKDENGQVLKRMLEHGDDLSKQRYVDFIVVFPDKMRAEQFAEQFRNRGFEVLIQNSVTVPELPWDVTASKFMYPTHQSITDIERELELAAVPLGGRNDGWGCFDQLGSTH